MVTISIPAWDGIVRLKFPKTQQTQQTQPWLKPGRLDLEYRALTIRQLELPATPMRHCINTSVNIDIPLTLFKAIRSIGNQLAQ